MVYKSLGCKLCVVTSCALAHTQDGGHFVFRRCVFTNKAVRCERDAAARVPTGFNVFFERVLPLKCPILNKIQRNDSSKTK